MSETALIQPGSTTMGLDTVVFKKMHDSMNLVGKSELQSLQNDYYFFRENSASKTVVAEKALTYGNMYHSYMNLINSFFNIKVENLYSKKNPLYFDEIEWGRYKLKLGSQLEVEINFTDAMWEAENKELEIFLVADGINELKSSFQEEFFVMWQVYSQESDENLTIKAKKIKDNLLNLVTGVTVDCD